MPPGSAVKAVYLSPVRPGDEIRCEALELDEKDGLVTVKAVCKVGDTPAVSLTATVPRPVP
jgi:acyl dehydratase